MRETSVAFEVESAQPFAETVEACRQVIARAMNPKAAMGILANPEVEEVAAEVAAALSRGAGGGGVGRRKRLSVKKGAVVLWGRPLS